MNVILRDGTIRIQKMRTSQKIYREDSSLKITVKSFVGGHDIRVYKNCVFDPDVRKYRGGTLSRVIPYGGRTLSAHISQMDELSIDGIQIKSKQEFTAVDDFPDEDECIYCIVSALYVAACRQLGKDTSRLLTIGETVVDENGNTIGCVNLNKN